MEHQDNHSEFAIHSSKILYDGIFQEGYLLVRSGKIIGLSNIAPQCSVENVGDLLVLPGIVDCHTHINEPGRTEWEGFITGTQSAISGGITTIVDMPLNCSPVTTTANSLHIKINETKDKLWSDGAFWGGIVPGSEKDLEELILSGVCGCKAFLIHSGIDDFPNVSEEDLKKTMPILKKYNLPLLVHAEITTEDLHITGDKTSYQSFLASRPKSLEDNAIKLLIDLCRWTQCHTHIVHLSSADALEMIKR